MTPLEFYNLCARHDWTYEFSDDYSAWYRGKEKAAALRLAMHDRPDLKAIFAAWVAWINSVDDHPRPVAPSADITVKIDGTN